MSLLATKPKIIPRKGMKKLTTRAAIASPEVCAFGEVGEVPRVWTKMIWSAEGVVWLL